MAETVNRGLTWRVHRASRAQARKTIVVWLALIVMFIAAYHFIGGDTGNGVAIMAATAGALVVVLFVISVMNQTSQFRRFNTENTAAIAGLHRGDLEAARATFWFWVEKTTMPRIAAIAGHNLAWTFARQGQLPQAIEVAKVNDERNLAALQAVGLAPMSAVYLALYVALAGTLDEARRWLGIHDARKSMATLPSAAAARAFAQAVIDCRTGNAAEAARALADRWYEYEAALTGDVVRLVRVVRAFARSAAGPREAGTAEMDLVSARPAFPGEYVILAASWPEMAAFLETNGLAG